MTEEQKDGRIDVLKLAEGNGGPPPEAAPHEYLTDENGTKIPLVVGQNCYRVIGLFVPLKDGVQVIVMSEGRKLAPKEILQHTQFMAQSILDRLKQAAKKIMVASDIPKGGLKRG